MFTILSCRYMGFPLIDHPSTDISRYFYIASKFIENGINSGGECRELSSISEACFKTFFLSPSTGKVLVHCYVGMSRSATCVLAYLMITRKMSAAEAIRTVRMHRDINPNEGFIQQLADLDNELKRERLYYWYWVNRFQSSPFDFTWKGVFLSENILPFAGKGGH